MAVLNIEYSCSNCNWTYNPSRNTNVEFADVEETWTCPSCQAEQDQFSVKVPDLLEGVETEEEANPEAQTQNDTPLSQRIVYTTKAELSIFELHRQWKRGDLNVQPEFQRYYVWTKKQASKLVESIFLNVPIPLIYVTEEQDGTFAVIDGQQRLTALFTFLDGEYSLATLEQRSDLNGNTFGSLKREMQRTLENYTLSVVQIRKESDPDVRFEVFERLNTGATQLNEQEIRNCVYHSPFNDFLRKQAKYQQFQTLIGGKEFGRRMLDVELVLRFAAFWDQTYLHFPKKRLKVFLNNEMERGRSFDVYKFAELEKAFRNSVKLCQTVFGSYAYRRFNPGNHNDRDGKWEKPINKALFDVVMWGFTQYSQAQVIPVADAIFEELVNIMANDKEFVDAIFVDTANERKVRLRFSRWQSALASIIQNRVEPRTFSLEWKKTLFDTNPTCAFCGQQIRLLDDAHVHHIEHYWRGGKTIPENSTLAHRYCNLAEGGGR